MILTLMLSATIVMPAVDPVVLEMDPGHGRQKVFKGKYHTITEDGDTVLMLVMNEITVFPPLKFKNKKEEDAPVGKTDM